MSTHGSLFNQHKKKKPTRRVFKKALEKIAARLRPLRPEWRLGVPFKGGWMGAARLLRPRRGGLVAGYLAAMLLLGGAAGWMLVHVQDIPEVGALEDFTLKQSTTLLAGDGSLLWEFAEEKRTFLPYREIPPVFINALVATEDARFWEHWGLDLRGIARAVVRNIKKGGAPHGASTLTQQLAKLLFLTSEQTYTRKAKEAFITLQIEQRYSKERILELYANKVYFANGTYGIEAASRFYFDKNAGEITLPEAALLVGVIKNPSRYNPFSRPENAKKRREIVLKRMLLEGKITETERKAALDTPLPDKKERVLTPPFGSYYIEKIRQIVEKRTSTQELYQGGLVIRCAMDPVLQRRADDALRRGLRRLDKQLGRYRGPLKNIGSEKDILAAYASADWKKPIEQGAVVMALVEKVGSKSLSLRLGTRRAKMGSYGWAWARGLKPSRIFKKGDIILVEILKLKGDDRCEVSLEQIPELQGAFLALNPKNGKVLAMTGGYDYQTSQFNRATQALRQTGSLFKPIVYATAWTLGYTPADVIMDEPTLIYDRATGSPYFPKNFERDYRGATTLRYAVEHSRNVVSVRLLNAIGYRPVIDKARGFGLSHRLSPYPSLALGAYEATLEEMVSTYSIFPNGGVRAEPRFIEEIRRPSDKEPTRDFPAFQRALPEPEAFLMTEVLHGVIRRGTGARVGRKFNGYLGGKTGTTDSYTDAWFVGFSPDLVAGVWIGYDKNKTMGRRMVGATAALPIWMDFMESYLEEHPSHRPPVPGGVVRVPVDSRTGLRVTLDTDCGKHIILESFVRGREPSQLCSEAAHAFVALPWEAQRERLMRGRVPGFTRLEAPPASSHWRDRLQLMYLLKDPGWEDEVLEEHARQAWGSLLATRALAIEPIRRP